MKHLFLFLILLLPTTSIFAQEEVFEEDSAKYGPGKVFHIPDVQAEFPGGMEHFREFVNMKFDVYDTESDVIGGPKEGTVTARFIVEPNGKVRYVDIIKSFSFSYDLNLKNILQSSPKWKPALVNGSPVRSFQYYSIRVNFYMR